MTTHGAADHRAADSHIPQGASGTYRNHAVRRQCLMLLLSMLSDEASLRRDLNERLRGLPQDLMVPVQRRVLGAAIKEPGFTRWLNATAQPPE